MKHALGESHAEMRGLVAEVHTVVVGIGAVQSVVGSHCVVVVEVADTAVVGTVVLAD